MMKPSYFSREIRLLSLAILWLGLSLGAQAQILPRQWGVSGAGSLRIERQGDPLLLFYTGELEGLYFLHERWAVGAQVGMGGRTGRLGSFERSVGPAVRYYLQNQADRWLFYLSASPAYQARTFSALLSGPPSVIEQFEEQELLLKGGVGASLFLGPTVLLDIQLKGARPFPLEGSPQASSSLNLLFGVMVLLPPANALR